MSQLLWVAAGGALGSVLRWMLGLLLNPLCVAVPLGTLLVNLAGGYLMGLVMGAISLQAPLPAAARLFLATGLLGGLTTFSTFSAEVSGLLLRQQWGPALLLLTLHVGGSLLLTLAGYASYLRLHG